MCARDYEDSPSPWEAIRLSYDPADAPRAEQWENRRDNRNYATKIREIAGDIRGKKMLFLGMGQEETAFLLAQAGAFVDYRTWSEKTLAFARKEISPDYGSAADRVVFRLVDPRRVGDAVGDYDLIVVMKAAKQLRPVDFTNLLRDLLAAAAKTPRIILHTSPNKMMTAPAFFLARIAGWRHRWKSREYGLQEHTYFSWNRMLRQLKHPFAVVVEKKPSFFSRQVVHQAGMSATIRQMALLADRILDSSAVLWLSQHRLVLAFLGTDLWAVVGGKRR